MSLRDTYSVKSSLNAPKVIIEIKINLTKEKRLDLTVETFSVFFHYFLVYFPPKQHTRGHSQ